MQWVVPGLLMVAAFSVFMWARHMANKPAEPGEVRLIPYTGIMFVAIVGMILVVAYAATLLGAT